MNRLDEQYRGLLGEVLYNGVEKKDRNGNQQSSLEMKGRNGS